MRYGERRLITETAETHNSPTVQNFILKEVSRPCKQWIHEVLLSKRETERVKLRTPDFVLLPDFEYANKRQRWDEVREEKAEIKGGQSTSKTDPAKDAPAEKEAILTTREDALNEAPKQCNTLSALDLCNQCRRTKPLNADSAPFEPWRKSYTRRVEDILSILTLDTFTRSRQWRPKQGLHWLAVATDRSLRTLRDLRGHHVGMLQTLYRQTCEKIQEETGIEAGHITAYVHYPPSVYQLHVHFKHIKGASVVAMDTLRVHTLPSIINNLQIDPNYYAKSSLQVPVYTHTELYTAITANDKKDPCIINAHATWHEHKRNCTKTCDTR